MGNIAKWTLCRNAGEPIDRPANRKRELLERRRSHVVCEYLQGRADWRSGCGANFS